MLRHCVVCLFILSLLSASGCQRQRGQSWNWLAAFGSPRIPAPANGTYQIQGTAATTPPPNSYYNPTGTSNLQAQPASSNGTIPASPAGFRQPSPGWQPQGNQNLQQVTPGNDRTSQQIDPGSTPVTVASTTDSSRLIVNDATNVEVPSSFQNTNDFQRFGALTNQPPGNSINVGNRASIELSGNANVVGTQQNRYVVDPYRNGNNYAARSGTSISPVNHSAPATTFSNVLATSTTNTINPSNGSNSGWQTTNPSGSFQR